MEEEQLERLVTLSLIRLMNPDGSASYSRSSDYLTPFEEVRQGPSHYQKLSSLPQLLLEELIKARKMKLKWTHLGMVFFLLLSVVMTGCFLWQYQLPKLLPDEGVVGNAKSEQICPRFPEPLPLVHPIPILKEALEKVDTLLRHCVNPTSLPALSAIVIFNDTVLWTGNFGKRNGSDPLSSPPNEYTIYRIASLSKIFPTLMLYRLWEEGLPRRLRATNLLWKGKTQAAVNLLQDDVLVADPGTKCHYSNLAFSLLAHVMAEKVVGLDYQRWINDNILDRLGMEDTVFDITPGIQSQLAVGVYSSGKPAPLYDLGWYRPSGQMYSTAS
ncbi:hypothetical protein UPYG_G00171200 [Umbra pygmaea]|uniref:Beta-lactamase-related domain-containing protein n=1 Tax=Umbra pygmaea TaxID=75934 RepID=A0ABD0XBJ1_UMBPY